LSNKGAQARTRPRRKREDRRSITPAVLFPILSKEARGGSDLLEDDPCLVEAAHEIAKLQREVWTNELITEHWRPTKERNALLAGAIQTVLEKLPSLYKELNRSIAHALEINDVPLELLFKGASNMVVDLGQAAEAVEGHWLLMHPDTRNTLPVTWETYAGKVMDILKSRLPRFSTEASYRFYEAIIPDLTGESPTASAVKAQILRMDAPKRQQKAP